jgi:hypothetical protein
MTTHTIRCYNDASAIGDCELTDEQFATYERIAQQPEGLIALCEIPGEVTLSEVVDPQTTVYLD